MKSQDELTDLLKRSTKLTALCRVCLSENVDGSVSLFKISQHPMTLGERVMLCARVQIKDDDGLPGLICEACSVHLESADSFRIKCEQSDTLLRKYYAASDVVLPGSDVNTDWMQIKRENVDDDDDFDEKDEEPLSTAKRKKKKTAQKKKEEHNPETSPKPETEIKEERDDSDGCDSVRNDPDTSNDAIPILSEVKLKSKSKEKTLKVKKFTCHICSKPLISKMSLDNHLMKMHAGRRKYAENVSGYGKKRIFKCTECEYTTPHSQSLVYHERTHTGEKPYRCDVCDKRFSQPGSLTCHKKIHNDKMYYTCALCGRQFKHKEAYERHKNVHIEEKKFTCTICSKGLKTRKTLEGHMNRHYNIKNFSCATCGNTFVTNDELINHTRKHTGERKFKCNLCEFKTYRKKGLEIHLLRHTGERPFKCDLCELACYTRGELKCHRRKHTKEKNYACPVCQLRFMQSSSVNDHMFKTHGIQYKHNNTIDRRTVK